MKIKTTLLLLSVMFIILIVIIGFIMFQTFNQINKAVAEGNNADEIVKDVFELNIVTSEYLIHPEIRMNQQWWLKYNSLGILLKDIKRKERHPEHLLLLETIISDYKALSSIFLQLQDNIAIRKKLIIQNKPQSEINVILAVKERLVVESLMWSQKIATIAFKLSAWNEQKIAQTQQKANLIILFSIIGIAVFSSYISFLSIRSITRPINELIKGTEIIGKGNLKHKIDIKSKDEIGELATAFNKMTASLEVVTTSRDELNQEIAERKKAEEELEKHTLKLEAANKELEAFSYTVSHDLRSPLRAIDGFSKILAEEYASTLDQEGQRLLKVISANVGKMGKLIDDILSLSRLGRKTMTFQTIDLNKLVKKIQEEIMVEGSDRTIHWQIKKLPSIRADLTLIQQVFTNLMTNAVKFTQTRKTAEIEIESKTDDGQLILYVKDNGVGFNMQYVDKIFEVFQRLHRDDEFEGTGVGLAIVRRIVQRHEGRIWAEAEVDKGATIFFTLPQKGEN